MLHIISWSNSKNHFVFTAIQDDAGDMLYLRQIMIPLIRDRFRLGFSSAEGAWDEVERRKMYEKTELLSPPVNEVFTIVYDHLNSSFTIQKNSNTVNDKTLEELRRECEGE